MSRIRIDLRWLLLVACLFTLGGRAHAEPLRASLIVTRDDGARDCPDSASLAARVDHVAGRSLFDATANEPRDTWVQVEFVRAFSGLRAQISARGGRQGTRTLDDVGPECASLSDAVAITLAILLDPTTAAAQPPPAPVTPSRAASVPVPTASVAAVTRRVDSGPPPKAVAPREQSSDNILFGVEASAGASFAIVNDVAPLAEAGARARVGDIFAFGAGGGAVFPERVDYGGGSIDVSLGYGYLRACANLLPGKRTTFEACLEPMLGALLGSGNDYADPSTESVFWSAAAVLLQTYGTITESVHWSARARVLAPFAQHGFSVERDGTPVEAFRLSGIGGSLTLGLDVEL